MAHVERTLAAERDFEQIGYRIANEQGQPETARRILQQISDQCDDLARLANEAKLGTLTPLLGNEVRLYSFKRWVILFRYVDDGVVILRIADGSQDYLKWKLEQP